MRATTDPSVNFCTTIYPENKAALHRTKRYLTPRNDKKEGTAQT